MSALVKQIIVEARGNTAHVEAAIKQLKGELKGLKTETTTAGAAGGQLGQRYATASVQIAGAAENMARAGRATGEATKMMLNQGAQMAFMFGTKGPIVGAVAIATLAIVELFGRTKKEAQDAADTADKAFSALARGGLAAAAAKMQELYSGESALRKYDPQAYTRAVAADPKAMGLGALREKNSRYNAFLAGANIDPEPVTKKELQALRELEAEYARYQALLKDLTQAEVERGDFAIRQAADQKAAIKSVRDEETERQQELQAGLDAYNDAAKRGQKAYQTSLDETATALEDQARLSEQIAALLVKQTKTQVDDIALQFDKLLDEAKRLGDLDKIRILTKAKADAIALQQSIEDLDEQARQLGLSFGDIGNAAKGTIEPKRFAEIADGLERSVRGAVQLAEAFGLIDERASKSLQAIGQIAASLPTLRSAAQSGQWTGTGGIIAAGLPIVGGIASVVDAFLNAGKAAREHAKALKEASDKLLQSITDRTASYGLNDFESRQRSIATQRRDDLTALLDQLVSVKGVRVGTRDDFFKADEAGQRAILEQALKDAKNMPWADAIRAALEQFDAIAKDAAAAAKQLEAERDERRKSFDQSIEERKLRLKGDTDAADAAALLAQHEAELAARRKEGIYTAAQLADLEKVQIEERKKAAEEARKRREKEDAQKAQDAARQKEDLQTRINAADGETPEARARRREIEKRRELEDAMAADADEATLALIRLAQAAEDAAAAADRMTEAQRALEDLDVRLLRAQGKTAEADQQEFENQLKREYEDAVRAGKSPEYLDKLAKVQTALRAQRQAELLQATSAAGVADGAAARAGGTRSAGNAVVTATAAQADRMVTELSTIRLLMRTLVDLTRGGLVAPEIRALGSGGTIVRNSVQVTITGPVYAERGAATDLGRSVAAEVNRILGQAYLNGCARLGDVTL